MTDFTGGYVYLTTITPPGKPSRVYVGKCHSPVFVPSYFGSGDYVKYAINTYGKKCLTVNPLMFYGTLERLDDAERYYIAKFRKEFGKLCRNKAGGGGGVGAKETHVWFGKKHTVETKLKMSINNGKRRPEVRAKCSGEFHPMFGKKGELSPIFGRKHSEITLVKMRSVKRSEKHKQVVKETAKRWMQQRMSETLICREIWQRLKTEHRGVTPPASAAPLKTWETFIAGLTYEPN